MENVSKKSGKWAKLLSMGGLGLCALCCALPVLGIAGGTSLLAILSVYAEKIALVLLIISAGLFALWMYKKKQVPPACSIDCTCKPESEQTKKSG